MATTFITPDGDAVVSEVEIAAPPERVFEAMVNRDQALQWGKNEEFETIVWELDPRVGGKWRSTSRPKKPVGEFQVTEFDHWGEVLEIDPPRLLAYTWFANWHENQSQRTVTRWELTKVGKGTRLKVTHSGLAGLGKACQAYSQGWPGLVDRLRQHVERLERARA